jgi:hypothetical protein
MLRKREEPRGKSIAMSLMRDVQGPASMKLAMFKRVRASGGFRDGGSGRAGRGGGNAPGFCGHGEGEGQVKTMKIRRAVRGIDLNEGYIIGAGLAEVWGATAR